MEADAQISATSDPQYEVLANDGDEVHPINRILLGLDHELGASVMFTLREPRGDSTFQVVVTEIEVDFDPITGDFIVSGTYGEGENRLNGRFCTKPDGSNVIGIVTLSLG